MFNCINQRFPTWGTRTPRGTSEISRGTPNFHLCKIYNENDIKFIHTTHQRVRDFYFFSGGYENRNRLGTAGLVALIFLQGILLTGFHYLFE